jgi:peroxisomal membrane protein 2
MQPSLSISQSPASVSIPQIRTPVTTAPTTPTTTTTVSIEPTPRPTNKHTTFSPHPSSKLLSNSSHLSNMPAVEKLWHDYLRALETKPILTKALSSAVLSAFSEWIAQILLTQAFLFSLNFHSILVQFIIGLTLRGPPPHYWLQFLDDLFARFGYRGRRSQEWPAVLGKVAIDQLTFGPFCHYLYFYFLAILEGRGLASAQIHIQRDFVRTLFLNWSIWPFVNIYNFGWVPPNLRILFGNVVGVVYTILLIIATK